MPQVNAQSLDLSRAPPVIFLYGLSGAGKNFVGDLIAQHSDYHVHHADTDLTPRMREALSAQKHFTIEMLDEYFSIISDRIMALRKLYPRLVVTQATYRMRHREYLSARIPLMELVWIDADDATIMGRLVKRGDAVTPEYASQMRAYFEVPHAHMKSIRNVSDAKSVIGQLNELYGRQARDRNMNDERMSAIV
jgi:gluconate kinase